MESNTFVTRLTRGAVASSLAVGWLMPENHSELVAPPVVAREAVVTCETSMPEQTSHSENEGMLVVDMPEVGKDWTPNMEREFRQLALGEAKATLTVDDYARLEELSVLRDRLQHPRTAAEVLLQLKRDRMLEKISDTLRKYVEFQEGAGKKRSAAA